MYSSYNPIFEESFLPTIISHQILQYQKQKKPYHLSPNRRIYPELNRLHESSLFVTVLITNLFGYSLFVSHCLRARTMFVFNLIAFLGVGLATHVIKDKNKRITAIARDLCGFSNYWCKFDVLSIELNFRLGFKILV
jgi:hypothetical protein